MRTNRAVVFISDILNYPEEKVMAYVVAVNITHLIQHFLHDSRKEMFL